MRSAAGVLAMMAACGGDGGGGSAPAPPDTCGAGRLSYADTIRVGDRALGGGDHGFPSYAFVPGDRPTLDLDDSTEHVHLEGDGALVPGDTVPARGYVQLDHPLDHDTVPYDFGNCETGAFSGTLTLDASGEVWQFTIEELHKPPYCSGPSVHGGFAGCYRKPAAP